MVTSLLLVVSLEYTHQVFFHDPQNSVVEPEECFALPNVRPRTV